MADAWAQFKDAPNTYDEAAIRAKGAAKRSEGVSADGSIPGIVSMLDPSKAGDNWTTIGVGQDGLNLTYAVPTKPGDTSETLLQRLKQNPKLHYGAFETDQAAEDFMRARSDPWGKFNDAPATHSAPADNWSNIGAENLQQAGITPPTPNKQPVNVGVDMARSVPGGLAQGAAGLIGLPGDAAHMGVDVFSSLIDQLLPGSKPYIQGGAGLMSLGGPQLPTSAQANAAFSAPTGGYYEPKTIPGQYAETAASFAPAAIGGPGGIAARTARVVAPAVASETAGQITKGTSAEPYARGAAALLTSGLTSLATDPAARSAVVSTARGLGPVTAQGAERMAADRLAQSATDPKSLRTTLNTPPLLLLPNSKPTTFQATGDMGLGALEREVQTKFPAEFQQRRADQNAARLAELQKLQPDGSPSDFADYVRGRSRWLDQQYEADIADATRLAQQRTESLGGNQAPEQYGAALRNAAQQAADDARSRERALWRAVDPHGDLTTNVSDVRDTAREIADSVSPSARPMEGEERAIFDVAGGYRGVVPFRELGDLRSRVSDAMRTELRTNGQTQAYGRLSRLRGSIEGVINNAVERQAEAAPDQLYEGLQGLDEFLTSRADAYTRGASAQEVGRADAYATGGATPNAGTGGARGGQFSRASGNQGVQGSFIGGNSAPSASLLQTIVRNGGIRVRDGAGKLTPEGAEISKLLQGYRLPGLVNNRDGLPADQMRQALQNQGWFGRGERFGSSAQATGSYAGDDIQGLYDLIDRSARGEKIFHPEAGAQRGTFDPALLERDLRQRAEGLGIRGEPGWTLKDWENAVLEREAVQHENLRPFDQEAADRLRGATQATRERVDTYQRGPVGMILQKAGRQDQFRLSDAGVPAKVFTSGAAGFENVQAYRRAVGDQQAFHVLQDYAAADLRHFASKADGTLDPAKVQSWATRHADALRAFPELGQRFRDASAASEAIGNAMAGRRAALDAFQTGAFSKIIGVSNPEDITRALGGIFSSQNRVEQMRQLSNVARRDPNAIAGLRKGVADFMQSRFIGNTEAATSGEGTLRGDQFQTFIRQNETALQTVFSADEVRSLKAIAADLQRANRSLAAVRIPGQSNTAQDLAQLESGKPSILRRILIEGAGATGGWFAAGSPLIGWLGAKTIGALRDAGMKRVDVLLREAMLNPEVARALLERVPAKADTGGAAQLSAALRRASLVGSALGTVAASRKNREDGADAIMSQINQLLSASGTPQWNNSTNLPPLLLTGR